MAAGKHTAKYDKSPQGDQPLVTNCEAVANPAMYKVSFRVKAVAFACTVITLSWFFEGWREINRELTLPHALVLLAGTVLTTALLVVQGYWTYIEEKLKGTLKKRIGIFETIYSRSSLCKRINGVHGDSGEGL